MTKKAGFSLAAAAAGKDPVVKEVAAAPVQTTKKRSLQVRTTSVSTSSVAKNSHRKQEPSHARKASPSVP